MNYKNLYLELGFSIIPLQPMSKVSSGAWAEFQERRASDAEIEQWFGEQNPENHKRNIGIVTGPVSGIVVLDIDGEEGERSLATLDVIPRTATVRTGRGRHLYFRHPGCDVRNFAGRLPGIDLRADGGYVVAPPSIHENGNRYEWEGHPGEVGIAELPEKLLALVTRGEQDGERSGGEAAVERNRPPLLSRAAKKESDRLIGELVRASEGTRNDTLNRVAFELAQHCAAGEIDERWARAELRERGCQAGLSVEECLSTIDSGFAAGLKAPLQLSEQVLTVLDMAPEVMDRPLRLINGHAYGATWLPVAAGGERQTMPDFEMTILGEDGAFYSERDIVGSLPIADLPFSLSLSHRPMHEKLVSPAAFRRWSEGKHPDPADVFERVAKGVDAFVSFEHSLADQKAMCELIACWIIGSYCLDAFDVVGYLWPTGERGSGKTQLLNTVSTLAYLGRTITSGSSFATIRDEADYGATIAFDDCEDVRNMENNKRELLLAGNMRGASVTVKEQVGEGEWRTRYVNNFAPRLFSSIGLPDAVLGSRTISIPLVASTDKAKTRRNPAAKGDWPVDVRQVIDDLWLVAVRHLAELRTCDREASELSGLHARGHDIWRMPLAIAWWLQTRHGIDGLFGRMTSISVEYQKQKQEVQGLDALTTVLMTLDMILHEAEESAVVVETSTISQRVLHLAHELDQVEPDVLTLDAVRVGKLIGRVGFKKGRAHGQKRSWVIDRKTVDQIAMSRSIELLSSEQKSAIDAAPPFDFERPTEDTMALAMVV